jgi:phage regulator Rha-like protein
LPRDELIILSKTVSPSIAEIERIIRTIRGHRVMLDSDLALLYGVTVKRLNEQVKRNKDRFPADFMFLLTNQEVINLKSQFATSRSGWGGRRKPPFAFTEHGTVMLANVLNSPVAVQASIQVVRAFLHLRELAITHRDLVQKINAMEKKYDTQFKTVFDAIRQMMFPEKKAAKIIGFQGKK